MAINLFDQITGKSSVQWFLGNKKPEPSSLSIQQTAKPTNNYVQAQTRKSSFIPQVNAWESLVTDEEIQKMIESWATDDEIVMVVDELEKERSKTTKEQIKESSTWNSIKSWVQSFWEWTMNVVWWVVAETPEIAWNIGSFAMEASQYMPPQYLWWQIKDIITAPFSDKTYWELRTERWQEYSQEAKKIEQLWKKGKEFVQKYWAYDPNSTWAKVWEIWADIVATVVWPWKVFKTVKEAGIAIKTLAWLANASIEWTSAAVSNYVATEWRLPTKEEIAQFIALQWWFKVGWKVFEQVKKLPSARLIPTTITEAWKDIRKWIDIGEAISTTWISFTKWQLAKKIEKTITSLSTKVDNAIWKVIKETWPNNITMSSLTNWLKKELMQDSAIKAQLKWTPIQMKQIEETIDETISAYKNLYWTKKFDLNAQQQLKKDIYTWLENVFNKNLQTWKITAQQATERQIARKIRTNIEEKVPEVIQLNKQLAPFLEAWKRLSAKWWYSGYLTDILAWWFASWSPSWIIQDPVWYAKNFMLWVIAKRAWTSTLAKTTASTLSANVEKLFKNPTFQKAVSNQWREIQSNKQ